MAKILDGAGWWREPGRHALAAKGIKTAVMKANRNINVHHTKRFSVGELDAVASRELEIYADNNADLYRQMINPLNKALITRMVKGSYDHDKAVKGFGNVVEEAAKRYTKGYGSNEKGEWHRIFNTSTRKDVAEKMTEGFEAEAKEGNYDDLLPKKYQKKMSGERYKSDEDIEAEFKDMKITELDPNKKKIVVEFPEGGEHVGGGTTEVCDYWVEYKDGKIVFDNWYPEKVYDALVKAIKAKKPKMSKAKKTGIGKWKEPRS